MKFQKSRVFIDRAECSTLLRKKDTGILLTNNIPDIAIIRPVINVGLFWITDRNALHDLVI